MQDFFPWVKTYPHIHTPYVLLDSILLIYKIYYRSSRGCGYVDKLGKRGIFLTFAMSVLASQAYWLVANNF